jgi:hypothetical protein
MRDLIKRWAEKNPERIRVAVRAYKERNREVLNQKQRESREKNSEHYCALKRKYYLGMMADPGRRAKRNEAKRKWRALNGYSRKENAARRAARIQATPSWGQEGIEDVYKEAEYQQMHVDHIVPLRSDVVCGLHVVGNLQLLTPEENMRKGNKFDPETYSKEEMKCIATMQPYV